MSALEEASFDTYETDLETEQEANDAWNEAGFASSEFETVDSDVEAECQECGQSGWWEGKNVETSETFQGDPVPDGSATYSGGRTFQGPYTNPTSQPSTVKPSTTRCSTTSGRVTFTSSSNATLNAGVNVLGATFGAAGTVASSKGTELTVKTCTTVGSQQGYILNPGEKLYCTIFDGTLKQTYKIPRWQIDTRRYYARWCVKCTRSYIHICGGKFCGPWQPGTGTTKRTDLDPITMTLDVPISGTVCDSNNFPLSPVQ